MIEGAIAEAGGALVVMFWLMVCSDFDSLMFLLVLSEVLLFSFTFLLLVCTFDVELDSL